MVKVLIERVGIVVMRLGAGALGGNILVERAAKRDIDELQAAADTQHRFAGRDELLQQVDLVHVAYAVAFPFRPDRRLAVGERTYVGAALQNESIQFRHIIGDTDVSAPDETSAFYRGQHEY